MASIEVGCTKQLQCTLVEAGGGANNPGDSHIPLGRWPANGWVSRCLLYAPLNFSGMTSITSATLALSYHAADGSGHVNGSGSQALQVWRKTADWSEGSGGESSNADEIWGGLGQFLVDSNMTPDGAVSQFADADSATGTVIQYDITAIVQNWFNGQPNYGVVIFAVDEGSNNGGLEFLSRNQGSFGPSMVVTYQTNTAPNAPVNLSPTGDQIVNTGTIVTLGGTRSDNDAGDSITGVNIQLYLDGLVGMVEDYTYYPTGFPTNFSAQFAVPSGNQFYQWRARTRDAQNAWGAWSAMQRFKANTVPGAPTMSLRQSPTSSVKTLTPTFNVTRNDADSPAGDYMSAYRIHMYRDSPYPTGTLHWDSGELATAVGAVSAEKLYNGPALSWQTNYYWYASTKDSNGAWGNFAGPVSFTTYTAPAPISLNPTGSVVVGSLTPSLTGSRSGTEHTIASYQIQVYESNGTTLKWDSGTLSTGITNGASFSKVYNGAALSFSTTYKWRARVTGNIGGTSAWTSLQTFSTPSATTPTQNTPVGTPITDLTPDFTGTWSENLNGVQVRVYEADGTTLKWDSGQVAKTSAASYTHTYAGTALLWNTTYKWQVSVRRSADNVWQAFTGLATFTTDSAGQPTLTAPIDLSWQTTLTPTFTGTTFNAEVITTFRIRLYESDGVTLTWDSGDLAGSGTSFSKVYNGANTLVAGRTYKWEARYIKSTGPTGNYSAQEDFHINAPPLSPSGLVPGPGGIVVGTLTPTFQATFEDADIAPWSDFPNQMEIEVRNNATDALIATQVKTTGLVAGTNSIVWDGTPALVYDTTYKWRVRFRDSKSVDGAWSSYNTFKPSQPSSVTITSPTGSIVSPQVPVSWNFSSPSGKAQGSYRVRVIRNSDSIAVYDSGTVLSTVTNHIVPAGFLINNTAYTIELTTVDTDGI